MTDMNALERLIAEDVRDEVGPEEPVDALAVASKAKADNPRWRFQSMFSATKFVIAGVIVALFGGFLLAGVLTQPSEESMPGASGSPEESPAVTDVIVVGDGTITNLIAADGALWVSSANDVTRIDPVTGAVTDTIAVASWDAGKLLPTDDAVWLVDRASISRIDLATRVVTDKLAVSSTFNYRDLSVIVDGSLWVAGDPELVEIDLATREIKNRYPHPFDPRGPQWMQEIDGALWLWSGYGGSPSDFVRFDLTERTVTGKYRHGGTNLGSGECCQVVDDAIWVPTGNGGPGAVRFDLTTLEVTDTLQMADSDGPPGSCACLTEQGLAAAGAIWYPVYEGEVVYRLDPETRKITDAIPVGKRPLQPLFADGAIWVPNADDGTLSRIDVESRAVTHTVEVTGPGRNIGWYTAPPIAYAGAIWVPLPEDGTVTRIATGAATEYEGSSQDAQPDDPATSPKEDTMKKLHSPMATALAIGLLASPTISADAQSDDADAVRVAPVSFTGRLSGGPPAATRAQTIETVDGVVQQRGKANEFELVDVSDTRLGGRMIRFFDVDEYPDPDGPASFWIETQTIRIVNDGGAWQGSRHYFQEGADGEDDQVDSVIVLVGEDDYEGLYAAYEEEADDFREFHGIIFPAPPPPPPPAP